ncbi:MAG: CDP-2,3-bis-(O-geranylgeranyl)-sn-glycerol synthase [Candidatus Doudnabacteria bacterium]|nr:CDP-2,3-bis-(O-geranylgeranyl)-sn-glycerol synthase [Candidatus Doudnabacteria bacterium]
MTWWMFLLTALWFILPGYAGNSFPVIFKRVLPQLAKPIDGGKSWRGVRIFGNNKTWRGLLLGSIGGMVIAGVQAWLASANEFIASITLAPFGEVHWALFGFLMGFGVLFGDAIESFFKRRRGIKPGQSWFPFDQIDALVGALALVYIVFPVPWEFLVFYLLFVPALHLISNVVAYWLGIKETWT